MKKYLKVRAWIGAAALLTLLAVLWAGNKIQVFVNANKVDVVVEEEGKNPFLYSPRLREIQKKLNKTLSFNLTNYTRIAELGFYNKETEAAMETFREMYHKKYKLQRYYPFSAEAKSSLSIVEGLLEKETPNPANFLASQAKMARLKNGDPATYYGKNAQAELQRIFKGMGADTIDPVTGEFSKSVMFYRSPFGGERSMPIQLSLRYSSQYSGNPLVGTGWFLTENYSIWFSYQKNEAIVQSESGFSQKFEIVDGNFKRKSEETDGGYFVSVELTGELGVKGSKITAKTVMGETIVFEALESAGGNSAQEAIDEIDRVGTIYGYSIDPNTKETSKNDEIKTGIYGEIKKDTDMRLSKLIVDKNEFKNAVRNNCPNNTKTGWRIDFYSPEKNYSFYRSASDEPNSYAGYQATSSSNQFGAYKVYQYNAAQKLQNVQSYSPSGKLLDEVSLTYNKGLVYADGKPLTNTALWTDESDREKIARENLSQVLVGKPESYRGLIGFHYDGSALTNVNIKIGLQDANYNYSYQKLYMEGINSPEMIKLYGKLSTNKIEIYKGLVSITDAISSIKTAISKTHVPTDEEKAFKDIRTFFALVMLFTGDWIGALIVGMDGFEDMLNELVHADKLSPEEKLAYLNLVLTRLNALSTELQANQIKVDQQLKEFDEGKMFKQLELMKFYLESEKDWKRISYTNLGTNQLSLTNEEMGVRAWKVETPYGYAGITYGNGLTHYTNFNGNVFSFYYDINEPDYSKRRVNRIIYPDAGSGHKEINLAFDPKGNVTYVKNEIGNEYYYHYDGVGNVTNKKVPGLISGTYREWSYEYTNEKAKFMGRPTKIVNPDGTSQIMTYDTYGEVVNQSLTVKSGVINQQTMEITSNSSGFEKKISDRYGSVTKLKYDIDGNLFRTEAPDGGYIEYTRDAFGQVVSENHSGKLTVFHEYDELGRETGGGYLDGGVKKNYKRTEYDPHGRILSKTDPLGNKTIYVYDQAGRLSRYILPDKSVVNFGFDAEGNKTLDDYGGKQNIYRYNVLGQMTNRVMTQTGRASYSFVYLYDSAWNIIEDISVTGNGISGPIRKTYQYDPIGIVTEVNFYSTNGKVDESVNYQHDIIGNLTQEKITKSGVSYYKRYISDDEGRQTAVLESFDGVSFTTTSSNIFDEQKRMTVKIDGYGRHSTNWLDFQERVTNLEYSVFSPETGQNEIYRHFYIYDSFGNMTKEVFPDNSIKEWKYNSVNLLVEESRRHYADETVYWKKYENDAAGHVIHVTDFEGKESTKEYDVLGYLAAETDPDGGKATYKNNIFGKPVLINRGGVNRNLEYDLLGNIISDQYGDLPADEMYYDAAGLMIAQKPSGNENWQVITEYDGRGRKIREIMPNGLEKISEYWPQGTLKAVKMKAKKDNAVIVRETRFEYDVYNKATNEIFPDGTQRRRFYNVDANGLVEETSGLFSDKDKDHPIKQEKIIYDQMDRSIRKTVSDPYFTSGSAIPFFTSSSAGIGIVSGTVFNKAGLPVIQVQPDGKETKFSYDAEGKTRYETNSAGEIKETRHDKNGNAVWLKDFDSNEYRYEFNGNGNLVKTIEPDGVASGLVYDQRGNISEKHSATGGVIKYYYDAKNRLTTEVLPHGGQNNYEYDGLGNITRYTPAGNPEETFVFHPNGTLKDIRVKNNTSYFVTSYEIDAFGVTNKIINPDGSSIVRNFDALGRMIGERRTDGEKVYQWSYEYLADGQIRKIVYPDNAVEEREYYPSGVPFRVFKTGSINDGQDPVRLLMEEKRYSENIPSVDTPAVPGRMAVVSNYTGLTLIERYDSLGRKTNVVEIIGSEKREKTSVFYYESINGKNCRVLESWKSYPADSDWNREVRDFRGNLVLKQVKDGNGNRQTILEKEYLPGGNVLAETARSGPGIELVTRYEYDAYGSVYKKTVSGGMAPTLLTVFHYDSAGRVIVTDENGRITENIYTDGRLAERSVKGPSGEIQRESYVYDHRGNTVQRRDELSKTDYENKYDGAGNRILETVTWQGLTKKKAWQYDFADRSIKEWNELGGRTERTYNQFGLLLNEKALHVQGEGPVVASVYIYNDKLNLVKKSIRGKTLKDGAWTDAVNEAVYSYDIWGNQVSSQDGNYRTERVFDVWGKKISETDPYGYKTEYIYDANSREIRRTMRTPGGTLVRDRQYDWSGNTTLERNTAGDREKCSAYVYDGAGNLVEEKLVRAFHTGDLVRTYGYDAFGNRTREGDWKGVSIVKEYDGLARVTKTIGREGEVTETSYHRDDSGNLIEQSSRSGVSFSVTYDGFGNRVKETDGNGKSKNTRYNAMNKPLAISDENGHTNYFHYDEFGRNTAQYDPYGRAVTNEYDSFGNAVKLIDKENRVLYREYDRFGRNSKTIDALGNIAVIKYDIGTLPVESAQEAIGCETEEFTDAEGNKTVTFKYGKLTLSVRDSLGNTISYKYNPFGELIATIDPKGNRTLLDYDSRGLKTKETTALGLAKEYQYDENGNLVLEKDGESTIHTSYDRDDRPVSKSYSDGNIKNFSYDVFGRLSAALDKYSSYLYTYDNAGRLLRRQDTKNNESMEYNYDNAGNRITLKTDGPSLASRRVEYTYDFLNQIRSETVISNGKTILQVVYDYNPIGRLTNKVFSTGVRSTYFYDALYRLVKIDNFTNGNVLLNSLEYGYDKSGNRTSEINKPVASAKVIQNFEYDANYRLVSADYGSGFTEKYTYDAAGNRLTKTTSSNVTHYTYDNDNRLMSEQSAPLSGGAGGVRNVSYSYDKAGRIVKKTDGGVREYYRYDSRDLMTKYWTEKDDVTAVSEYIYDVNNLRVSKTDSSDAPGSYDGKKRFVYDGDNILYEGSVFYLNNIVINSYEAEIQELRIAVFLKDALGSIRSEVYDKPITVNTKVSTYASFEYTAFGESLASSGEPNSGHKKEGIGYTGHYLDRENGLYYARARYYNPGTGRFITSDPIGDPSKRYSPAGLNRYVYGLNNPLFYTDPSGLWNFGFGITFGWTQEHGFSIGIGIAADFSEGNGTGLGAGLDLGISYNFGDNSISANASIFVNLTIEYVSVKASLGYSYNTNSGRMITASIGASILCFGAEVGTTQYWDNSGNYRGGITYVEGFIGSTANHMGGGYQWGSGDYQSETGAFMEMRVLGGISAKIQQNGRMTMSVFGISAESYQGQFKLTSAQSGMIGLQYSSGPNGSGWNLYSSTWNSITSGIKSLEDDLKNLQHFVDAVNAEAGKKVTEAGAKPTWVRKASEEKSKTYKKLMNLAKDLATVSADVYDDPRMEKEGLKLPDYIKKLTPKEIIKLGLDPEMFNTKNSMNAWLYKNEETGQYILAYRGTEDLGLRFWDAVTDWATNVAQGLGIETPQYEDAKNLARTIRRNEIIGNNFIITGQSLGGGLASAGGMITGVMTYTFDASGLNPKTVGYQNEFELAHAAYKNIVAFDVKGEVLWNLQERSIIAQSMPDAVGRKIVLSPVSQSDWFGFNLHAPMEMVRVMNREVK